MDNRFLKLDWLGFTFKPNTDSDLSPLEQFLIRFIEFDKQLFVIPAFNLGRGYKNSLLYCDIVVSYNDLLPDMDNIDKAHAFSMGVNVQVPSHCLDMFCSMLDIDFRSEYAFRDLVLLLFNRGCKLSRIDICYDDYEKHFDAHYYDLKKAQRLIASPCRTITTVDGGANGTTIYFGSLKKRNKLLRIYDKFAESGGEIDAIRYEFEYHGDCAMNLAEKLLEYDGKLPFLEMLLSVCRIVDDTSKIQDLSHRKTDDAWLTALKGDLTLSSKIRISPVPKEKLSSLNYYIECQALSSIAGYVKCFGRESLYMLIKDAITHGKISPRYMSFYNKLKYCNELVDNTNSLLDDCPF